MGTARTREEHLKRATGSFDLVDDSARAARAAGAVDSANLDDMREAPVEGASPTSRKAAAPSGADASARTRTKTNNPRVLKAEADAEAAAAAAKTAAVGAGAPAEASTAKAAASGARPSVARSRVARPQAAPAGETSAPDGLNGAASGDSPSVPGVSGAATSSASARRRARRKARSGASPGDVRGAGQGASASDAAQAPGRPRRVEAPARRRGVVAALVVIGVLAALLVAALASFSVFRWIANDDVQDIQGTWYVSGADTPVVITEGQIQLNEEVAYWYDLNTDSKTIAFTFSYLEGAGRYRFSLDRQQLAIVDGTYGWWDTFADDTAWTVRALISLAQGTQLAPADGEEDGVSSLTRTPASGAVSDASADGIPNTPSAPESTP